MNIANEIETEILMDDFIIDSDFDAFDDVDDPIELLDIANDNNMITYN